MENEIERDLVAYIMGLWHMDKMRKMRLDYNGAIKLRVSTKGVKQHG